jgi:hypothetical protein
LPVLAGAWRKISMTIYQKTNAAAGSTQEDTKVRYTAKTHTLGGRRGGVSRSDDGRLDVKFSAPGVPETGTNPEQLFAAGCSCARHDRRLKPASAMSGEQSCRRLLCTLT